MISIYKKQEKYRNEFITKMFSHLHKTPSGHDSGMGEAMEEYFRRRVILLFWDEELEAIVPELNKGTARGSFMWDSAPRYLTATNLFGKKIDDDNYEAIPNVIFTKVQRRKNKGKSFIFIPIEKEPTEESLKWVFWHELGHVYYYNEYECSYYNSANIMNWKFNWDYPHTDEEYTNNDDVHESYPKEIFANLFANTMLNYCMDRHWWRKNYKEVTNEI